MRVISGSARGARLITKTGSTTRPTADRIKETVFNMIAPHVPNSRFLDLFSGSGAIGIEALSRGAEYAALVEHDKICVNIIERNLKHVKLYNYADIYMEDVFAALKKLSDKKEKFDIIYADPPYDSDYFPAIAKYLESGNMLNENGLLLFEHSPEIVLNDTGRFVFAKDKKFKNMTITFMQYK